MDYDEIAQLRNLHPAWILLRSNNVALVLSFLGRVFVDANASDLSASTLASLLDEELYALNQRFGDDTFPKSARAYLDDWASSDRAWLIQRRTCWSLRVRPLGLEPRTCGLRVRNRASSALRAVRPRAVLSAGPSMPSIQCSGVAAT